MKAFLLTHLRRAAPWAMLWVLYHLVLFEALLMLRRWGTI